MAFREQLKEVFDSAVPPSLVRLMGEVKRINMVLPPALRISVECVDPNHIRVVLHGGRQSAQLFKQDLRMPCRSIKPYVLHNMRRADVQALIMSVAIGEPRKESHAETPDLSTDRPRPRKGPPRRRDLHAVRGRDEPRTQAPKA